MTQEVTVRELSLPDTATLEQELKAVRAFQATVKKLLIEGHDYGVIPGTGNKPTLLKPGAEKIDKILHLADTYEVLNQTENWEKGFFHYEFKCRLIIIGTDVVVSEGMGSCNSMESKYRYRWVFESGLPKDIDKNTLPTKKVRVKGNWVSNYRIENDDIYTLTNTILKMAKKRAHIDASLSAGRLSDVFTQDIEDITESVQEMEGEVIKPDLKQAERDIEEYWGEDGTKPEAKQEAKPKSDAPESQKKPSKDETTSTLPSGASKGEKTAQKKRDPNTIKTVAQLAQALKEDFGLSYKEQYAELNITSWNQLAILPAEAYQQVASIRK